MLFILQVLAAAVAVNAHGKLAQIRGANGATAKGLAIVDGTPGTGSITATEADTTIFGAQAARNPESLTGCGKTKGGGVTDCATAAAASLAMSGGVVPTADADGTLAMTFHQVNQDGAGPLTAMVSTDMGQTWQKATVNQDVDGIFGLSTSANKDFPVSVTVPPGTTCSGTAGSATGVCLVALANPIQGFGGSAPFAMSSATGSGNTTATAATGATNSTVTAAVAAPATSPSTTATTADKLDKIFGGLAKRDSGIPPQHQRNARFEKRRLSQ